MRFLPNLQGILEENNILIIFPKLGQEHFDLVVIEMMSVIYFSRVI